MRGNCYIFNVIGEKCIHVLNVKHFDFIIRTNMGKVFMNKIKEIQNNIAKITFIIFVVINDVENKRHI